MRCLRRWEWNSDMVTMGISEAFANYGARLKNVKLFNGYWMSK